MHPYLHEYYSVARFKAAYATPIPALIDQSQWPEVDFEFSMCPPLPKERLEGLELEDSRPGLRKVGVVRGEKDDKPKWPQKGNKNRCKLCEELGHRAGSPKCRYTPEKELK
jgi:hypothetical protein